jgi:stearoyl-CoA desaturase (delta-9 desaturase)
MKLARGLKTFPRDVIRKGEYQQKVKQLDKIYSNLRWGPYVSKLPQATWKEFRYEVDEGQRLIVIDGFVYDIGLFESQHPGGRAAISAYVGKDATKSFNGGVYSRMLFSFDSVASKLNRILC